MKVLFVCSGNVKKFDISPIVKNQGESLINREISLDYFGIKGKGFIGYFMNIFKLKNFISAGNYDIIHGHYSFSGIIASLATNKPIITSLMGSDINIKYLYKLIIKIFSKYCWKCTIVKSESIKNTIGLPDAVVIPNGVDFERFIPMNKELAKKLVNFDQHKKYIIFIADPEREEKNFLLAKTSFGLLKNKNIELYIVFGENGIDHNLIPYYINAADVLLLTSKREGSPNVIKEAMACNCPIVSTNVGDVNSIIGKTNGCYITSFSPIDIVNKLTLALNFSSRTNGRKNIHYLDNKIIAKKIIGLYNMILYT
jgi:glycosyltransferase involved in cell wall biosynthesis